MRRAPPGGGWLVGVLCPKGHRVQRHAGGRITCQQCGGRSYSDSDLIPKGPRGVKRPQRGVWAAGYQAGYEAGCAATLGLIEGTEGE